MDQQQTNTDSTYVVAVAFSRWPLGQLLQFLEDKLSVSQSDVGVMRIDRSGGKETNRTIMLVSRSLYNKALEKGYSEHQPGLDFKLTQYELKEHNLPKDGYSRNFFIPLPPSLTGDEARDQLQNKLNVLSEFGMFSDSPRLKIPLKSRETGEHKGQAYVTFSQNTPTNVIALARVLLHDTRLYTTESVEYERMRCFWAREKDLTGRKMAPNKKGPSKKRTGRGPTKVTVNSSPDNGQSNEVLAGEVSPCKVTLPPVVSLENALTDLPPLVNLSVETPVQ